MFGPFGRSPARSSAVDAAFPVDFSPRCTILGRTKARALAGIGDGVFVGLLKSAVLPCLAAVSLFACAPKKAAPPPQGPPTVGVVTLAPQIVELTAELPGRTTAFETADVRPQVNGVISKRLFVEGSLVRKGQPLYQIDAAPYRAALDQAKAQLANAQALVVADKAKSDRYGALVKINAVARQDYDDAIAAYRQAAASVAQQRAAVETAQINVGYTTVSAPISGRIGRSAVTVGGLATTGQTTALATIQKLDPIYVDLVQSAPEVLRLRQEIAKGRLDASGAAGVLVHLKLDDGITYPIDGLLKFTDVTVDQSTGSVTLRAEFPNPSGFLLPGLYVRAVIVEGVDRGAILAPQRGVTRNEKGAPTAMVVNSAGKVQQRDIVTARTIGDQWLVTSGLAAGDRLIVDGLQSVKPNMPVHAVAATSLEPAARTPAAPPTQ
jgi:membrane fusion protein (multidrug efflux system)